MLLNKVSNPLLKHGGLSHTPATAIGGQGQLTDYSKISQLLGVAARNMVRKRYIELVVDIPKGAPQALTHYAVVIWMGQYIPAIAESRKAITCFLDSTGSGLVSKKCEPR